MKRLIDAIISKWFCQHEWEPLFSGTETYWGSKVIDFFQYQCKKCGKFKRFTEKKERKERFKMPTDQQIAEFAMIFNDGEIDKEKLISMVGMCMMILDRLHEHGDILIKSTKEKEIETDQQP